MEIYPVSLTPDGHVVLHDDMLAMIEESCRLTGGGGADPTTTNGTCGGFNTSCVNNIHCSTSHNKSCTNNRICPDTEQQIEA